MSCFIILFSNNNIITILYIIIISINKYIINKSFVGGLFSCWHYYNRSDRCAKLKNEKIYFEIQLIKYLSWVLVNRLIVVYCAALNFSFLQQHDLFVFCENWLYAFCLSRTGPALLLVISFIVLLYGAMVIHS